MGGLDGKGLCAKEFEEFGSLGTLVGVAVKKFEAELAEPYGNA